MNILLCLVVEHLFALNFNCPCNFCPRGHYDDLYMMHGTPTLCSFFAHHQQLSFNVTCLVGSYKVCLLLQSFQTRSHFVLFHFSGKAHKIPSRWLYLTNGRQSLVNHSSGWHVAASLQLLPKIQDRRSTTTGVSQRWMAKMSQKVFIKRTF